MKLRAMIVATATALAAATASETAEARMWSKDPAAQALDYLMIQDQRGTKETVIVLWLSSALIPDSSPNAVNAKALLDKYMLIATLHAQLKTDGTFTPIEGEPVEARGVDGGPLPQLDEATQPPAIVGALATVQSLFTKMLGPFGKSVHWTVFDGSNTKPCGNGGFRVVYAGETYTYDTPIPGCK